MGGNVTHDEWVNDIKESNLWSVYFDYYDNEFYPIFTAGHFTHVAFHTKEQAEEFLKYPENVQLLKNYFILIDMFSYMKSKVKVRTIYTSQCWNWYTRQTSNLLTIMIMLVQFPVAPLNLAKNWLDFF